MTAPIQLTEAQQQEFHERAMDYRGATIATNEWDALCDCVERLLRTARAQALQEAIQTCRYYDTFDAFGVAQAVEALESLRDKQRHALEPPQFPEASVSAPRSA